MALTACRYSFVVLLVAVCASVDVGAFTDFVNQLGQAFDFQCGQQVPLYGYGISGVAGVFSSGRSLQDPSDRRWQYRCSPADSLALNTTALSCRQIGTVNRLPGTNPLRFTCPDQGFLSGLSSIYEETLGDRVWNPFCCQHSFGSVVNCQTTGFLNSHGSAAFNYSIPATAPNSERRVIVGFEGFYIGITPNRRDRQWKYTHCELVVNCSRPPSPLNGRFSGGGLYLFNDTVQYTCDDSYYLSAGSAERTCLNNGRWSGTLPTCTKCTAIADCQELRCTSATDQYCMRCNSHFPGQAQAYRNSNRTCDALCSWQRNFCYPGTCPATVDTCQCSDDFAGPSCLTIAAVPLLSCSVQLVANGGSRQRTACSNGTVASPIVFYSSVRLADLLLQWDVSYSGPTPAPTAPAYVQPAGYSVGVISTQAYGALSRASDPSLVVANNSLVCTGESMSAIAPRTSMVQCSANATLSHEPLHNDRYQLSVSVTNGGYLTLTNFDTGLSERHFYNGSTLAEVTNIIFDFHSPDHCSVGGSLRCNAGEELLNIGPAIIRSRNVTVSFGGWSEPLSAIDSYTVERYDLEVRGDTICERSSSRTEVATLSASVVQSSTELEVLLPSVDAAYSFILAVQDTAGNARHARRVVLSDASSAIQIDQSRPITVVSAYNSLVDGRTVAWQPDITANVEITAVGHFYNTFSRQSNFLNRLCQFATTISAPYDQPTTGQLPRTGTRNAEGIVEMYYSVVVNPVSVSTPPDNSTFIQSSSLEVENLTLPISRQDSDTVVVWLRAQDLYNQTDMDSVVFLTDSTPPLLSGLTLIVNSERALVFNTADATKLVFEFKSQDDHSGLQSLAWTIGTSSVGSIVAQGRVSIPLQNMSDCAPPSCVCARPLNAPCQMTTFTVSLSTMSRQLFSHDGDYFLSVTSTNNAGLETIRQVQFTVDVSPPRGGYVKDNTAASYDLNYQSVLLHQYSWSGFVDGDSEIRNYQVYVGSSCLPAQNFTHPPQAMITVTTTLSGQIQHAVPGTYYVSVAAVNNAFLVSTPVCSDGVTIDTTPPSISQVVINNTRVIPGLARDDQGQVWYINSGRWRSAVQSPSAECSSRARVDSQLVALVPIQYDHRGRPATVSNALCMASGNASGDVYIPTPNHLLCSWQSEDSESRVASFSVAVTKSRNSSLDVVAPFFTTRLRHQAALLEHSTSGLEQGQSVYLHIKAVNNAQLTSEVTVGPIHIDASPPIFSGSLNTSYNHSLNALHLSVPDGAFQDSDTMSPLVYSVAIGETADDDRVLPMTVWTPSRQCRGANRSCFIVQEAALSSRLHSGQSYQVHLRATNPAGLATTISAVYWHITGVPSAGIVLDIAEDQLSGRQFTDLDFSNEDVDVCTDTAEWSARWYGFSHPSHPVSYHVAIGTSPSDDDVIPFESVGQRQMWSSQLANDTLQSGTMYYTLVRASNGVGSTLTASDGCRYLGDVSNLLSQVTIQDGDIPGEDVDVQMSSDRVAMRWQAPTSLYTSLVYWKLQQVTPVELDTTEYQPIANTGSLARRVLMTAGRRYRSVVRVCHAHSCYGEVMTDGFLVSALPTAGRVRATSNATGAAVQVYWDAFPTSGGQAHVEYYEVAIGTSEVRPGEALVTAWQRVPATQYQTLISLNPPITAYHEASATVRAHVAEGRYIMAHSAVLWNVNGRLRRRADTLIQPRVYDLARIPLQHPVPTVSGNWRDISQQNLDGVDVEYTSITTRIAAAWPQFRYPEMAWSLSDRPTFLPLGHASAIAGGTVRGTVLHADVPALQEGRRYYVCILADPVDIQHEIHNESLANVHACSDGFTVDTRPPVAGCVWAGPFVTLRPSCSASTPATAYTSNALELPVVWEAFTDVEATGGAVHPSGVQYYEIGLGTQAGRDDTVRFQSVGMSLSTVLRGITLQPAIQYFVSIRGYDFVGLSSQTVSHPIVVDITTPEAGSIWLGNTTNPTLLTSPSRSSLAASWSGFTDTGSTSLTYHWALGSRPAGSSDIMQYTSTSTAAGAVATGNFQDGSRIFVSVQASNDAGLTTLVTSPGFLVDRSPPTTGVVYDGGVSASINEDFNDADYSDLGTAVTCRWSGFSDAHTSIVQYELAVGTCSNCSDVQTWMPVGLVSVFKREGLPLQSGQTYFCRVRACNGAQLCTSASSDGITFDSTPPIAGVVSQPSRASGSRRHLTASTSGFLDAQSSVLSYKWGVGTTPGASDVLAQTRSFNAASYNRFGLTSPLPTNQSLYTSVIVHNRAGAMVQQVSAPFSVDVTSPSLASGSSLAFDEEWAGSRIPGTQISAEGVRLTWQFQSAQSAIASHTVTLTGSSGQFLHTQRVLGSARYAVVRATLHDGERYTAHILACNMADSCTTATSGQVLVDSSPPIAGYFSGDTNTTAPVSSFRQTNPTWRSVGGTTTITLVVHGFSDPQSGITHFTVDVDSVYFGRRWANASRVDGTGSTTQSLPIQINRHLSNGDRVFISVTAWNAVGLESRPVIQSFIVRANAADNSTGELLIERSTSCRRTSCAGHCTCPLNSGFCDSDSSGCAQANASLLPLQDRVSVYLTRSLRLRQSVSSVPSSRSVSAYWSVSPAASRPVLWFDWSVGRQGEMPGSGVFNTVSDQIWYPVGQQRQVTTSLATSQELRHGTAYVFYVRAWYTASDFVIFSSSSFVPDLKPPVRATGGTVRDMPVVPSGVSTDIDFASSTTRLAVSWSGVFDASATPSGIGHYLVGVGTSPGLDNTYTFSRYLSSADSASLSGLRLQHGVKYYVTVRAVGGNEQVTNVISDGVTVDTSPPQPGVITIHSLSQHARITTATRNASDAQVYVSGANDPESGVVSYTLLVGTTPEDDDVMRVDGSRLGVNAYWSLQSANLMHNMTYYITLATTNAAGLNTSTAATARIVHDETRPTAYTCGRLSVKNSNPSFEAAGAPCPASTPSVTQALGSWSTSTSQLQVSVAPSPDPVHGCVSIIFGDGSLSQNIASTVGSSYRFEAHIRLENCFTSQCRNQTLATATFQLRIDGQARTILLLPSSPSTSPAWRLYSTTFTATSAATNVSLVVGDDYRIAVGQAQILECEQQSSVSSGEALRVFNSTAVTLQQTYFSHDTTVLSAEWQIVDEESGVIDYRWAVGSVPGGEQYQNFRSAGQQTSCESRVQYLPHASDIYVTVVAWNGAGVERLFISERHVADHTPPAIGVVWDGSTSDVDYQSGLEISVAMPNLVEEESTVETCTWTAASNGRDILPAMSINPTTTARRNLSSSTMHGQMVYSTVCCRNGAGLVACAMSDGVTILSLPPSLDQAEVSIVAADQGVYSAETNIIAQDTGFYAYWERVPWPQYISHYEMRLSPTAGWTRLGPGDGFVVRGTSLDDGNYMLRLRSVDRAGQVSDTVPTNFTVDTALPGVSASGDVQVARTSNTSITVDWSNYFRATASGLLRYEISVGTAISGSDVVQTLETRQTRIQATSRLLARAGQVQAHITLTAITPSGRYLTTAHVETITPRAPLVLPPSIP